MVAFISQDSIRSQFSSAMSQMYRKEVPAYSSLVSIVNDINQQMLDMRGLASWQLDAVEDLARLSAERHGAIRVGTAQELSMIRRIFAVMGMYPVGYYDLGVAGIPVHSTAFRPTARESLAKNPFRVFTSLLRLDLIDDEELREVAKETLSQRNIFTEQAISLTKQAEVDGGLSEQDAETFVSEVLETFRWGADANVSAETYQRLKAKHPLVADVVSFRGPHINHLTPRTLDIDTAQQGMIDQNLPAKAVIEGPPKRQCPILLRQTSFKAIEEKVQFVGADSSGTHTARFGEIEERGVALTPKGRALYDELLAKTRAEITPNADGSNAAEYQVKLESTFAAFPDDWRAMHDQGLAYFRYKAVDAISADMSLEQLLDTGSIEISPIIYEDFLPVSAAGIFQSNLGGGNKGAVMPKSNREQFVEALGVETSDEFGLYAGIQEGSLAEAMQ
ncbi:VOC family protein [Leucothrix sargassi]|nr:VOC family protein [Leucothrix sargassi]